GAPSATGCWNPSKMTFLASEIRRLSSAFGVPVIPNIFFWKEPLWSNARMYRFFSYPSALRSGPTASLSASTVYLSLRFPSGGIVPTFVTCGNALPRGWPLRPLERVGGREELDPDRITLLHEPVPVCGR